MSKILQVLTNVRLGYAHFIYSFTQALTATQQGLLQSATDMTLKVLRKFINVRDVYATFLQLYCSACVRHMPLQQRCLLQSPWPRSLASHMPAFNAPV